MPNKKHRNTYDAAALAGIRVLLVGHRAAISDVLERLAVPFAVWHDKPMKNPPECLHSCTASFAPTQDEIRSFAAGEFSQYGPFTHVIAGTESAVYVASICRRVFNARRAEDSIALYCSDKQHMKLLMRSHDIPMTDFVLQDESFSAESILQRLGPKVVIKQRANSGGRGLSIASNLQDITARTETNLLYEKFVDAAEMSIETFVRDNTILFTSTTSYLVKTHANLVPANVPTRVLQQAHAINRRVIEALNLDWGLTHAEFYWNEDTVLFGEIALRPPGGYIMECMSLAHDFDAWEAFVANELDLPVAFGRQGNRVAGVALLHAGKGTVRTIENADTVRDLPSCVRLRVLLEPGDREDERIGISEVSAYGLFVSDSASTTEADVRRCLDLLRFNMDR